MSHLAHVAEAVIFISNNRSVGPVSSKKIAENNEVPPRYLERFLQILVRVDILRGVRGPGGGYTLGRDPKTITLADLWQALYADDWASNPFGTTLERPIWKQLQDAYVRELGEITIAALCETGAIGGRQEAA